MIPIKLPIPGMKLGLANIMIVIGLYYLDVKDFMGRDEKMYMHELEKFKTFEEAKKEVDRLNNIPSNKKQAKQWNTRDKFILQSYLERKEEQI